MKPRSVVKNVACILELSCEIGGVERASPDDMNLHLTLQSSQKEK